MKIFNIEDAKKKGLMQLTLWVRADKQSEIDFIQRTYNSVMDDIQYKREAMIVQRGGLMALFVNRIA